MSEERGTPRAQPPTAEERELLDGEEMPEGRQEPVEPPRVIVPRWVQLVLLPISLLALWALARAAGKVLLIFVVAGLIALILNPLVAFMQQRVRLPRGLAVLTVYLAFFLTLAGVGFLLANPISNQVRTFTNNLPHIVNEANSQIASFQAELNKHGIHAKLVSQGKTALQTLQDQISKSTSELATFGGALLTEVAKALVDLVLVFVLSVYMLVYGQSIGRLVREAMPAGDGTPADDYPRLAQHAVSRYVGGQLLFSVVMGASTGDRPVSVRRARHFPGRAKVCARIRCLLWGDGVDPLHRPNPGSDPGTGLGSVHRSNQRSVAGDPVRRTAAVGGPRGRTPDL